MNDFQFMPKIMKQLAWVQFSGLRFFPCGFTPSQPLHTHAQQTQHLKLQYGANQVGEMFANYNLIAAIVFFYCHYWQNIRVENSHTLSHLFAEDLVLCLSIS
jgi:hypothetical protein